MTEIEPQDDSTKTPPPLTSFDLSDIHQPTDGVLYLYRSAVDGFWYIDSDEDLALQEATQKPVGELVDQGNSGNWQESEYGDVHALFVGDSNGDEQEQLIAGTTIDLHENKDSGGLVITLDRGSTEHYSDGTKRLHLSERETNDLYRKLDAHVQPENGSRSDDPSE